MAPSYEPDLSPPPRRRAGPFLRRHAHAVAAALLAGAALLLGAGALRDSPTVDEANHLVRGLAWWKAGDTRLSVAHPPLANLLQAAPAAALGEGAGLPDLPGWKDAEVGGVARGYLARNYAAARIALVLGRLVTAAIALLLGLYLYGLALAGGRLRALAVLALYAAHPVILAHGHLVTTDLPVAAALTVAAGETWRFLRTGRRRRLLTLSLALGAALATKFSAGLYLPPLVAVAAYAAFRREGPYRGASALRVTGRFAAHAAVVAVVCVLLVGATYRFQRTGWTVGRLLAEPEPTIWTTTRLKGRTLERFAFLDRLPRELPVPLPYSWVYGLAAVKAQDARGHGGWFLGGAEHVGAWYYFPLLLAVKSPAAHLALLAVAAVLVVRRRRRLPSGAALALAVPPATYLAVSLGSNIQLGVRHVLPVVPALVLVAGWAAARVWRRAPSWGRYAAPALVVLAAAEALHAAPRFLGHFSLAIGGRAVGHRINVIGEDWGQDVAVLGRVAHAEGLAPLYYRPYGPAAWHELRREGVVARRFDCGEPLRGPAWLAVHASAAVRNRGPCGPVGTRPPDRILEDHLYLYRIEPEPAPAPPTPASPDPGSSWAGTPR